MTEIIRRTWAEIDLDALAHNYRRVREATDQRAARHDDGDGVVVVCHAHGPKAPWTAGGDGDILIAARLAVGYIQKRGPDPLLELCTRGLRPL